MQYNIKYSIFSRAREEIADKISIIVSEHN